MGRPRLDISDEERYERHKERCKNYKKNRMENDPEYKKKVQEYNINYLRGIVIKGKEAKELRIKKNKKNKY